MTLVKYIKCWPPENDIRMSSLDDVGLKNFKFENENVSNNKNDIL